MKKFSALFALPLVAMFALASCEETPGTTDEAKLTLTPPSFDIPAGDQTVTKTVAVEATGEWAIGDCPEWITPKDVTATGFSIDIEPYIDGTDPSRVGNIVVEMGAITKQVTVTQAVYTTPVDPEITIDPDSFEFDHEGGTESFAVESELDWTVRSNNTWITATKTNDTTFSVEVDPNDAADADERTGTVTVDNGTETATLTITQTAPPVDRGTQLTYGKGLHMTEIRAKVTYHYFELNFAQVETNMSYEPKGTGSGYNLFLRAYTDVPAGTTQWELAEGTYTFSTTRGPLTLFDNGYGDGCWLQTAKNGAWESDLGVAAGSTMTVSGNSTDGYDIDFSIVQSDETVLKAYYTGMINMPR